MIALGLAALALAGAGTALERTAAARGRQKLDLILLNLNGQGQAIPAACPERERLGREALGLAIELSDRRAEALALRHVARCESLSGRFDPAFEDYFLSRRIFREVGDTGEAAATSREIDSLYSAVYAVFTDLERARLFFEGALQAARRDNDGAAVALSLEHIAANHRARDRHKEAIPLYREALRLNERHNVFCEPGTILSNLGDSCLKAGDRDGALDAMKRALAYFDGKRAALGQARALALDGQARLQNGDLAGARDSLSRAAEIHQRYFAVGRTIADLRGLAQVQARLGQAGPAGELLARVDAILQRKTDWNEIMAVLLKQAAALRERNDLHRAEALLLYCESAAGQKQLPEKLREAYGQLSSLYSQRRDPARALYYRSLARANWAGLPSTAVWSGMQKLIDRRESDREIAAVEARKRRQALLLIAAAGAALVLVAVLVWRRKALRRWLRDRFSSRDQRLQKRKAKLRSLQERLARRGGEKGNDEAGCLDRALLHMRSEKPYLASELTLKDLAAGIGTNANALSRALNAELGMGFSDFVNHFRIEEALRIMSGDDRDDWDVIDVCFETGFNSLSSFYRVFKMHTGLTPAEFQRGRGR